jgi:hypothetical protein
VPCKCATGSRAAWSAAAMQRLVVERGHVNYEFARYGLDVDPPRHRALEASPPTLRPPPSRGCPCAAAASVRLSARNGKSGKGNHPHSSLNS